MDKTRNRFYLIMILTSLLMIGVLVTVLLRDRSRGIDIQNELTRVAVAVNEQNVTLTAVATYTPPPTPTAMPEASPTPDHLQTVQAEATRLRTQIFDLQASARNWETVYAEVFADNEREWATDAGSDEYSIATRSIDDGTYTWEVEAVQDFFWVEAPEGDSVEDFYLSAEISQAKQAIGEQGVIFRYIDIRNFYYFSLCDATQQYQAGRRVDSEWFTLISCNHSDLISVDNSNLLEVIGKGQQFLLSINGQFVSEMLDTNLATGRVGLIIEMDTDEINTYTFHKIELRTPE